MTSQLSESQTWISEIKKTSLCFDFESENIEKLAEDANEITIGQGETLLRSNTISTHAFIVMEGSLRLLASEPNHNELFTVGRALPGDIVGVVDLMRQGPCEAAIARQQTRLLSIKLELILEIAKTDKLFLSSLLNIQSPCEDALMLSAIYRGLNPAPKNAKEWISENINMLKSQNIDESHINLLSSVVAGHEEEVGKELNEREKENLSTISKLPLRYWKWFTRTKTKDIGKKGLDLNRIENIKKGPAGKVDEWSVHKTFDMTAVGLKEANKETNDKVFEVLRGKGPVDGNLAIFRMIARAYETPCPIDVIEKALESAAERTSEIPIQGMGQIAEAMGLQTQIGTVRFENIDRLELPVLISNGNKYTLLTETEGKRIHIVDPEQGLQKLTQSKARTLLGDEVKVILFKRLADTPKKTFGWGWFTPVLKRFKWPLVQVLLASLFIQLFQLANPLLIQQIIDKVINQSNLSALQVLGAALVASALFQGLLTAVRTWLLIDTTDRMDLLLGSQVIDKLLRLPLRFFEKRPVGELSQRLSELGNLRGFLTGTAITSTLDLLFATIYIFIMLMYSPLLTATALGTVPIYVVMILVVAPLYRKLIRSQAQYSARTQSHLIETLSGIQTVKAQHFELNSRWRWQDRYSGQISEGFKSVVLGSSIGEIGNFLNQLSSLLIIWVGVYQVVNGELSLGQLIAFRIIAGYVTGPILRLSGLWQGFQQVGISMERLADIVDQIPEAGENEADKISLPTIQGNVRFENLKFQFFKSTFYQVNNVNLEIEPGSFVGIVGQSGSGKSTLMKLLPRLYEPNEGKILIDGYDISKVSMSSLRTQIGIVPQDCLLFEGTIRENISMNLPEAEASAVIEVAKIAAAHDFIMELPDGYATQLGERGAGLSGGQRQRIAIARTIMQNPSLLIMDEATSALDYETEGSVCINLQKQFKNKTVFFITHRLSTVRHADLIIMMHQGKIVEKGTHKQLMELGGRYSILYGHQGDS